MRQKNRATQGLKNDRFREKVVATVTTKCMKKFAKEIIIEV